MSAKRHNYLVMTDSLMPLQISKELQSAGMKHADLLYQGKFIELKRVGSWEYVQRCNSIGCVAILAFTSNHEIILVEQFRLPLNKRVIELPAGLAGDTKGNKEESLAEAAIRELLEETGYVAARMKYLAEGPSSAGITTEVITFFQALDVKKTSEGGGDATEEIQVHTISINHLKSWLEAMRAEGCLVDYKIQAALCFARMNSSPESGDEHSQH